MSNRRATPSSVAVSNEPREPLRDPTLGVPVSVDRTGRPKNRLVTIGDSLTHGFMSAAIFRTDLSWPAIIAHELGLVLDPAPGAASGSEFRYPHYEPPGGPGGLPFDLERVVRAFERRFGANLDFSEIVPAGLWLRSYMDKVEDYWERGDGTTVPQTAAPYHNLSVYGWDVLDPQVMTVGRAQQHIDDHPPKDNWFSQLPEDDSDLAARIVLASCAGGDPKVLDRTVFDAARRMGEEGTDQGSTGAGIETLVVMLGANNALGSVIKLEPAWTPDDYLTWDIERRIREKGSFTVWQPPHFADEWGRLVTLLRTVRARHVIIATVPQVTIAPICRGVGGKVRRGSRYFRYYTRPWIGDDQFEPDRDPHFTEAEARAIDSAVDAYNETIRASVEAARRDGLDWYLFDLGAALDGLASRRYKEDPTAQPPWWKPYVLPPALAALEPPLDTRFYGAGEGGRTQGGIFSLDGVHPTTSAYGLVADEIMNIMSDNAGVAFYSGGVQRTPAEVSVDFERLLAADGLLSRPPKSVNASLSLLAWLDQTIDWVSRILPGV